MNKWTPEAIIRALREGVPRNSRKAITQAAEREYGTFEQACRLAGVAPPLRRRTTKPTFTVCEVEDCGKPVRYRTERYCNAHYNRIWRTGLIQQPQPKPEIRHSGGYILERLPNHPLSTSGSRYVYQHRRIYYDTHGAGPFHCHVCSAQVGWDTMHVDHLDDDPTNNTIGNLAPACPTCNQWRGREKMVATKRSNGRMLTLNGETLCLTEWAERLSISPQSIRHRLATGWPIERALTEARGRFGPRAA